MLCKGFEVQTYQVSQLKFICGWPIHNAYYNIIVQYIRLPPSSSDLNPGKAMSPSVYFYFGTDAKCISAVYTIQYGNTTHIALHL